MIYLIIISGICFTVGNIVWPWFGNPETGEPKLFYVPLAVFILSCLQFIRASVKDKGKTVDYLFEYLVLLAIGNLIKQLFYTDQIKQINDYFFGGFVTIWLFYRLKLIPKVWEIITSKNRK